MAEIIAVVTIHRKQVEAGGATVFHVDDEAAMKQIAFSLEKILDASAHDLKTGTFILVNHAGIS